MIEKIEDLELDSLDSEEKFLEKVKEKLNLTLEDLLQPIFNYINENSNELVKDTSNIAPHGDYGLLLETDEEMSSFLKETCQIEYWKLYSIIADKSKDEDERPLVQFNFVCIAVDDGNTFKGFTYTNYNGKILHAFAHGDD